MPVAGCLPGLEVGQKFHCRAEIKCIGGHVSVMAGIDHFTPKDSTTSLCAAICVSGGYEDDEEVSNEFWYTGQGGNDFLGSKQQMEDHANPLPQPGSLTLNPTGQVSRS